MAAIDRQHGDTPRSFAALCDLAALGPGRSLEKYRQSTGKTPAYLRQLERWSSDHSWMARLSDYDQAAQREAEADRAELRAARRRELEDRDWSEGVALRESVASLLAEMPRFLRHTESEVRQNGELVKVITLALRAGPGELARALKLASEIQRLSVGEPTEIHKLVESELGAILDLLESQLAPEEYARIITVIAGSRAPAE